MKWASVVEINVSNLDFWCRMSKPEAAIGVMEQLKRLFDPNLILNPYKFLPSSFWARQAQQHAH